jgi:hypothetical protein
LALIFDEEKDDLPDVVAAAQRLRAQGHLVSVEARGKRLRRQLDDLAAHGTVGYVLFGEPDIRPLDSRVETP